MYIGMVIWYTGMHAVTGVRWDGVCQMRVLPYVAWGIGMISQGWGDAVLTYSQAEHARL